jgi:plastocyanin
MMSTRLHFRVMIHALAATALGVVACGQGAEQRAASAPSGGATAAPTDTADGPGIIAGTMTYEGTPAAPKALPMDSDPRCPPDPKATSERLVVGAGSGLQNVFVYVKDGLGNRTYAIPATPVVLDQKGCRYVPHVFGVQVGQTVTIANSDPTLHNVHAIPKTNREFNFGQPANVPPVPRTFDKPEVMVPFRCDVHSWMNAYVGVVPHPFFAVTEEDGTFEIKGLPPGTYTIEAWHEELGTQTQSVTVDGKAPAKVSMTFKIT